MSSSRLAFPALLLGAAAIGFAGILVRLSEVGPTATGFWRMAIALPLLWTLSFRFSPKAEGTLPYAAMIMTGVFFALDLSVWHQALYITTVANATLIANCIPVFFVPLIGWFIWREAIGKDFAASFLITLLGIALLTGENVTLAPERFRGDILSLLAAAFYCGYLLLMKASRQRVDVARMMAVSGAAATVVLLVIALMKGEQMLPQSSNGWMILIGLALLTQVVGQTLIAYGLGHLPTHVSALGLMFQPVVSAVAAWLILGQNISAWQLAGASVIVFGVWLAKRRTA